MQQKRRGVRRAPFAHRGSMRTNLVYGLAWHTFTARRNWRAPMGASQRVAVLLRHWQRHPQAHRHNINLIKVSKNQG